MTEPAPTPPGGVRAEGVPARGPGLADAAGWAAAEEATRTGREQLQYLLGQQGTVHALQDRFANIGAEQRGGHVFEWEHEVTFNLDAIAKHEQVRARVTEWLGEPHAPADLRLYDASGAFRVASARPGRYHRGTALTGRVALDAAESEPGTVQARWAWPV